MHVDIIVFAPTIRSRFGPRVEERYLVTLVPEAWISAISDEGTAGDPKRMMRAEIAAIAVLGNPIAVIATSPPSREDEYDQLEHQ
jgi:hypothetical protein